VVQEIAITSVQTVKCGELKRRLFLIKLANIGNPGEMEYTIWERKLPVLV
jgi:hypothetical protein